MKLSITNNIKFLTVLSFLVLFFLVETYFKNEIFLTFIVIIISLISALTSKEIKTKILLWLVGVFLGFLIEVCMGLVSRNQYWSYGSLFGVPFWLPFAWGLGFETIYELGKILRKV